MTEGTYESGPWSLDDLIPAESGSEMESVFADLDTAAAAIESRRSVLIPEIEETAFVEILGLIEKLARDTQLLDGYSILKFFADTQDQEAIALRGRVDKALAEARNRTIFFELWWKALDDGNAKRLLAAAGDNAHNLATLRSFAPHTLSETEERVINLKNVNGADDMATPYRMITGSLTFDIEIDGKTHVLTRSQLMDFVRDASPDLREAAYRSLLDVYGAHRNELAQIYKHIAADWHDENVVLRGISSPISARNLKENVPDEVVEVLLEACRENVGLCQRYFGLKANWPGVERLRLFDLYAPLDEAKAAFPFADGVRLILESYRRFSPRLAELAERVLAEGHLDSIPGRASVGAASAGTLCRAKHRGSW